MMKRLNKRLLSLAMALLMLLGSMLFLVACDGDETEGGSKKTPHKDYAGSVTLDMSSDTLKQEVTVKAYIDGDTTHFYVPTTLHSSGVIKARYLAVNTPESTGKIEEWGKTAAKFTKEKLVNATSIVIESDDSKLNADSTGDRFMLWIWYKPQGSDSYRNLNIELLQEGLAIASNAADNRYGETCVAAINQAKAESLHVHSDEKDPNFPYGSATELTLKELRCNIEEYDNMKVAFEGVITNSSNNSVYMEEYDPETDRYYGITVYYGYNFSGESLMVTGNRMRIVGSVQYYETGDSYQVAGLQYFKRYPNDPDNIKLISEGNDGAYLPIDGETLLNGQVTLTVGEEKKTFHASELALYTSVEMTNLKVIDLYTTTNEDSASNGAISITCRTEDGKTITVRTVVLFDSDNKIVKQDVFVGKTIDVKGVIDRFNGEYQIKLFSLYDVTFH